MTDRRTLVLLLSQYVFDELESSSEEDDSEFEYGEILTLTEVERHPRQVGYLNTISLYSDADFFRHFRVSRTTFNFLCVYLQNSNFRSQVIFHGGYEPMSMCEILYINLYYLGNQGAMRLLSDKFNRTESSVCNIVGEFCKFMFGKQGDFIKFPSRDQVKAVATKFWSKANFPGVVSAFDGCHIPFHPKAPNQVPYRNYKKFFRFNLMAAALPDRSFSYVFCGFPGSVHDSTVFQNSSLYQQLEEQPNALFNSKRFHIIADSAFSLKECLITPYEKVNGRLPISKKLFNKKLSSTRMVIELAFGDLKNRFKRCIDINTNIEKGVDIVVTCCVLQNICIQQGDLFYGVLLDERNLNCHVNPAPVGEVRANRLGEIKRQNICDSLQTRRPVIAFRR